MAEYINKAEAIIAGMAVALEGLNTPLKIRARFDEIPAADVVEVVRCKNCKHRDDNDVCFMHHDYGEFVYLDGYCNYAEEVQGWLS